CSEPVASAPQPNMCVGRSKQQSRSAFHGSNLSHSPRSMWGSCNAGPRPKVVIGIGSMPPKDSTVPQSQNVSQQARSKSVNRYRMPDLEEATSEGILDPKEHRPRIEPWLAAMFQSEHLSLLLGNGFTVGTAQACGAKAATMEPVSFPKAF